jgi:GNAT superfamily N-acetyltransferase
MGPSEGLEGVTLTPADIPGGLALSIAAGWNQSADDWAFFVTQGHASGFRAPSDGLVATTAAVVYGGGIAWISMVLVAHAWRHRGLASLLLERTLRRLEALHVTPVLDATPAGEPVYRHLGFRTGFRFERWERVGAAAATAAAVADATPGVRAATRADVDTIATLDQLATRLGRRALLQGILARAGSAAWITAAGDGFVIARPGQRATQLGPLVAPTVACARTLLDTALAHAAGPLFLDVPVRSPGLADLLAARGFARQRPFARMALGRDAGPCDDRQFVLAGPEYG